MAKQDLVSNVKIVPAFDTQAISTNTTTAGDAIDTKGFESVTLVLKLGAVTDGDYALLVEESDASGSGYSAVADADLIGTEASASFSADTDDHDLSKIGYKGKKRYVKMSVVSTNVSSGATATGICILGHPENAPYTTQIVSD